MGLKLSTDTKNYTENILRYISMILHAYCTKTEFDHCFNIYFKYFPSSKHTCLKSSRLQNTWFSLVSFSFYSSSKIPVIAVVDSERYFYFFNLIDIGKHLPNLAKIIRLQRIWQEIVKPIRNGKIFWMNIND